MTIVGTDYDDVFVEELNPENPNEVKWQGQWHPLRVVTDTIEVRGEVRSDFVPDRKSLSFHVLEFGA